MMHGNANIAAIGKATRFGSPHGPNPCAAARKKNAEQHAQSIRIALRRLMGFEVDMTQPITFEMLARAFTRDGRHITMAQACAVRLFQQAMHNWKAMDRLIEHVDGKQVEPVAEARVTLEQLVAASYNKTVAD